MLIVVYFFLSFLGCSKAPKKVLRISLCDCLALLALLSLQLLQLRAPKKEDFFCCSSFLLVTSQQLVCTSEFICPPPERAGRVQRLARVLSLLGVGGSCCAEPFGGGGGLLVEDRSSWAKRINHLESFRLKISRCQVQLTVNYVLFVCTYTESTDRVFLRYRYGNYREIPTEYRPKIPNRYTTLRLTSGHATGWPNYGVDGRLN